MTPNEAITELKSTRYSNHALIEINQDIEVLRHQMTGLARSGPELSPQQAKSPLPMPTYQHDPDKSPVALIDAVDAKEKEARYHRLRILYIDRWFKRLSPEDRTILAELYLIQDASYEETAERHGYTKKGLWLHLRSAFEDIGITEKAKN